MPESDNRLGRTRWLLVAVLTVIGCSIWLYRLGADDYDWVVAEEVLFAREPLRTIVFHNQWIDQSPLPFVIMRIARVLGEGPFAVKLPNVVILAATVPVVYLFVGRLCQSSLVALAATALFVVSPVSLWCARYGRIMYPLELLLSILVLHSIWGFVTEHRRRWLTLFAAASAVSIYNHFYGFLVVALALFYLVSELGSEAIDRWDGKRPTALLFEPFARLAVALAAVQLFVQPQIIRAISLLERPFRPMFLSLRGSRSSSILRLVRFWLNGYDLGASSPLAWRAEHIYITACLLLFVVAWMSVGWRLRWLFAVWIGGPMAIVAIAASTVDLRERYFIFVVPLVIAAMARGGAGSLGWTETWGWSRSVGLVRGLALVVVVAGSGRLLAGQLQERTIQWTKLLTEVNPLLTPTTSVYACPDFIAPALRVVAERQGLDDRLARPRTWSSGERSRFDAQIGNRSDVLFLTLENLTLPAVVVCRQQLLSVAGDLERQGYRRRTIRAFGAAAEVLRFAR